MAKNERLNEEAALNNNLSALTYQKNPDIAKLHEKPKTIKQSEPTKKPNSKLH